MPEAQEAVAAETGTAGAIFTAAAQEFAERGFDAAGVDRIADPRRREQGDALLPLRQQAGALHRSAARHVPRRRRARARHRRRSRLRPRTSWTPGSAPSSSRPRARPWFPPIMLRELASGAPRLDPETFAMMNVVYGAVRDIVEQGQREGVFARRRSADDPPHDHAAHPDLLRPRARAGRAPRACRAWPRRGGSTSSWSTCGAPRGSWFRNVKEPIVTSTSDCSRADRRRPGRLRLAACAEQAPSNALRGLGLRRGHRGARWRRKSAAASWSCASRKATASTQGAVIARLDTRDTELQMARIRAERDVAAAQLRLRRGRRRGPRTCATPQAQVDAARGRRRGARGRDRKSAELDLERFESLLAANAGSQKQRDDAQARLDALRERQRGAAERVRVAREAAGPRRGAGARPEEVGAARARIGAVTRSWRCSRRACDDAVVKSPAAGIVTQDLVDAGEIVAPRTPLVVVTDLDHAWANAFVPEPAVPRIKLGQTATVHTDAGQTLPGHGDVRLLARGVHAAQRADRRGALEAGLPHQGQRGQLRRHAQAGHAGGRHDGAASERRRGAASTAVDEALRRDGRAGRPDASTSPRARCSA